MATTGPARYPGSQTFPGSDQYPGQGDFPMLEVLYTTDDASVSAPVWLYAHGSAVTNFVRTFQTSRGRGSEREDVDAGTASGTLDNRGRDFDPTLHPELRPGNRIWLRERFSGETQDLSKGYASSYDQQWPAQGKDAICVVRIVDEFKPSARNKVAVTNPPRDSYSDVVLFDEPALYHSFQGPDLNPTVGNAFSYVQGVVINETPIIGDQYGPFVDDLAGGAVQITGSQVVTVSVTNSGDPGDAGGLGEFALECWFSYGTVPGATNNLITGPSPSDGGNMYSLAINSSGQPLCTARNSGGTVHTATSGSALTTGVWYHAVATITGGNLRLYINGAQVASTAWTGVFGTLGTSGVLGCQLGGGSGLGTRKHDELAFYRHGLSAARVTAHYEAGTQRGFPKTQLSGARAYAVLDSVQSHAPRRLDAGTRQMTGAFMHGQSPLEELRQAAKAEAPDGVLFISRSGDIVLLDSDHRSSAPYDTVQATFDDDGTDLPYLDVDVDYSDSFLGNKFTGSRLGGPLVSASDAASIDKFGAIGDSLTDLPVTTDVDAQGVLDSMLAKYKEPFFRVLTITPKMSDPDVAEAVFRLDIGDRIRVFRRPPSGAAIDQTLFIQKIDISGEPGKPWRVVLGVSPV